MATKALSLVFAAMIFTGCTRETSTRRDHETEKRNETATVHVDAGEIPALRPEQIERLRENAPELVIRFRVRLAVDRLENERRHQTATQREDLYSYLERAAKTVATLESKDENRHQLLRTFTEAVTAGCDENLKGCRHLDLFRESASVRLLLVAADDARPDLQTRYRYLTLAFELAGEIEDPRLPIAYIQTAAEYERWLETRNDPRALERHREVFEQTFARLKNMIETSRSQGKELALELPPSLISGLENSLDIWNFDRTRRPERTARDEILFSLVVGKLFEKSNRVELTRQLERIALHPNSVRTKIESVTPASRRVLGLKENLPSDVPTFIFENLWLGRITSSEATIAWNAYEKTFGDVAKAKFARENAQADLLNYARTRFLVSAKDANKIMSDFFNSKGRFTTANAFQDGMKESLKGASVWTDATRRLETLQQFNARNLRSAEAVVAAKELDLFFASIDRNIKMTSTYPSMLIMNYHLARLNFSLKVQTWSGAFEIKAGQILESFFSGKLDPWMPYGSDRRALSKSEIQMAFYYALEMGTLRDGSVQIDHLFKMMTDQMAGPVRAEVQQIDDNYRKAFENAPLANEFYRLCSQIEAQGARASLPAPPIPLVNLKFYTMLGTPQSVGHDPDKIHPTFSGGWGFFEIEPKGKMRLDENLEVIRLELTPKIDQIRLLARIAADHLERISAPDRESVMKEIEAKIVPLEKVRQQAYSIIFKTMKRVGPCGEKLVQAELNAQLHLIEGLETHFRDVHVAMKALRAHASVSQGLDKRFGFSGKVALPGLVEHEAGLGFNADMYRMSRLQALLRMTDVLENGFTKEGTSHPGVRDKGAIVLPARLRDIDEIWRTKTLRVDWTEDADEFVTNGIQQIVDPRHGFTYWTSLNPLAVAMRFRVRALITLVKAGVVQTNDGPQRLELKDVIRANLVSEKWLEVEGTAWMNILNITGEYSRAGQGSLAAVLDDFAWRKSDRQWLGSLDYLFGQLSLDKLGEGSGDGDAESPRYTRRNGPRKEYLSHIATLRSLGGPALEIPDATIREMNEFHTKALDLQMNLVGETLNEVRRLEPLRAANPKAFPSWRLYASRRMPEVPLLGASEIEKFRADAHEFARQTGYVLPAPLQAALKP